MSEQPTSFFIGKHRRRWWIRCYLIILGFFFMEWGYLLWLFLRLIVIGNYHPIGWMDLPGIFLFLPLYLSVAVRSTSFWSVDATSFTYHDDHQLYFTQKWKAFCQLFMNGYYTTHTYHYQYEEISYVHLYYRQKIFVGGYLTHPLYFKIYLRDGSCLDAPFVLDSQYQTIYQAFQFMQAHGVLIDDPYDLLTLLRNNQRLDERMVAK